MRKAIFWDFHGTLTTHDHLWTQAAVEVLGPLAERYGVTWERIRPLLHRGFPWHPDGNPALTGEAWWEDRFRQYTAVYQTFGLPEREGQAAAQRLRAVILDPKRYRVRPDAAAALAVCAYKGYQNYLLSNNFPELEKLLEGLYLRQFFAGCIVSGKVGLNKPDVKLFRLAERTANFPGLIWMVGDNPKADVEGPKSAGWLAALLGEGEPGLADVQASTLTELTRFF